MDNKIRCKWCNLKNPKYIEYHDKEWGVLKLDDNYLFEMLILESFQAGLSWECILNKRDNFKDAFDGFDFKKVSNYANSKVLELSKNKKIIRNKRKIEATINNSKVFINIIDKYGSFNNYLKKFTKNEIIYETGKRTNELSDTISKDLISLGMKFVGSTIIYSYLQAIGIINSHEKSRFLNKTT